MDVPQNSIIPSEIFLSNIFPYLDTKSSIQCEGVCQSWNKLMNESQEKVNEKIQLFYKELGFQHCFSYSKPHYLYSKLSGIVGGWKKFRQLPKMEKFNHFAKCLGRNLVERRFRNPFLELKDMKAPVMTGIDCSGYPFVAALVNEKYNGFHNQGILVLFEFGEQLLCHYKGELKLSSPLYYIGYFKSNISEEQQQKIFDLLNGKTIKTQTVIHNLSDWCHIQYKGTATVAKEGFKSQFNF